MLTPCSPAAMSGSLIVALADLRAVPAQALVGAVDEAEQLSC